MEARRPKYPTHLRSFTTCNWRDSRQRFKKEVDVILDKYSVFETGKMFTEADLTDDFWSPEVYKNWDKFGHSFYAWKPYILLKGLSEIRNGDVLMYSDGGCNFRCDDLHVLDGFVDRLCTLIDEISVPSSVPQLSVAAYKTDKPSDNCAAADCCLSLLDFFGLRDDENFTFRFPHYEAGVVVIRKTPENVAFVENWWHVMRDHLSEIFSDTDHGLHGFFHNSCDQAVMQALLYKANARVVESRDLFYGYGYYARFRG